MTLNLEDTWLQDVVRYFGLIGLCAIGNMTINHDMLESFVERWHKETSSFHTPHGDMSITLDDVSCLLHIPIWGRLLKHSRTNESEALELMVNYLGADQSEAQEELDATRDAHA